jgi:O-acetyl-ADP-ribose deacetylase (regulator of RNase III)
MTALDCPGHVFIVPGDLTALRADVVVFSTSTALLGGGHLFAPFAARFPWFADALARAVEALRLAGTGCAVGHAFCLEPPDGVGPAVVVVASTIDRAAGTTTQEHLSRDECARRATRGALAAAGDYLKKLPPGGRRLVALPALRMGLGGDRNDRLRSARTQVRAARDALPELPGVDAAFVPFTPDNHQIFLQARRDVLGGPPACPLPEGARSERLVRLVRAVRAGRCVLFAGSGLSWQLPSWNGLLNALAAELGRSPLENFDLRGALDLAEDYLWEHGGSRLAARIRDRYANYDAARIRPTHPHCLLLALPLRLVITTNYDDLLERTLTALRRHHRLVLRDRDVLHTGAADPLCVVKFHGDPTADGGRGIVLARGHYEAFRIQHPGLALLLAGSLLNQTFLFVGYSRVDPNFSEIFEEVAELYRGAAWQAFATSVDPPGGETGGQLEVLQMPGADAAERIHQLALFLDWLADAVLLGHDAVPDERLRSAEELPAGLFLTPDVRVSGDGAAQAVRRAFLDQVAAVVEAGCDDKLGGGLGPQEARHLARVLHFLVEQGWRPADAGGRTATMRLSRFWERLAEAVGDVAARERCLAAAWRFAERYEDVRRLGKLLGHAGR